MGKRVLDSRLKALYDAKIPVYSYSKINTYHNCMFDYFQAYIMKIRSPDNIYSKVGGVSHDAVEEYYKGEVPDLQSGKALLLKTIGDSEMMGVGFPEDPPTIKMNYIANMSHFFDNHIKMEETVTNGKMLTELFVLYKTPLGRMMQMYIDVITVRHEVETESIKDLSKLTAKQMENYEKHLAGETVSAKTLATLLKKVEAQPSLEVNKLDAEGNEILKLDENGQPIPIFTIIDWKSSTKFAGAKKIEAGRQLLLYKLGVEQMTNRHVEKLAWNMLKYVHVRYTLKSGKVEASLQQRKDWVSFLEKRIMDDLIENGEPDIIAGSMVMNAIQENSLDSLPQYIRDKYWFEDALVEYESNDQLLQDVENWVDNTISEIESKDPLEVNFPAVEITEKNNFFCGQLCRKYKCPQYAKYMQTRDDAFDKKEKPQVKDRFDDLFSANATPKLPAVEDLNITYTDSTDGKGTVPKMLPQTPDEMVEFNKNYKDEAEKLEIERGLRQWAGIAEEAIPEEVKGEKAFDTFFDVKAPEPEKKPDATSFLDDFFSK